MVDLVMTSFEIINLTLKWRGTLITFISIIVRVRVISVVTVHLSCATVSIWCHLLLPMVIYYLDRKVRYDQGHFSFNILISSTSLRFTDSAKNR